MPDIVACYHHKATALAVERDVPEWPVLDFMIRIPSKLPGWFALEQDVQVFKQSFVWELELWELEHG
jgi:hypothetical protein